MRYHFSGIGGAGMNPLARLMIARGHRVQGSDRAFDRGENAAVRSLLEADGIIIVPQDGLAVTADLDRFVYSVAVEADTPEMCAAHSARLHLLTRPQLLAEVVGAGTPGVAVAGTSGKSSITGMLAWILRETGVPATVLGGAALALDGANHMGCFSAAGEDAPVVAEACESDGSLVGYAPGIGVIHNISRDHDEVATLRRQFEIFADRSRTLLVSADCPVATGLGLPHRDRQTYGIEASADHVLRRIDPGPHRARGELCLDDGEHIALDLPQPGRYVLENAMAAVLVARSLGLDPARSAGALRSFPGIARRYQVIGTSPDGVTVIDDYAHNGAKIAAALHAAQLAGPPVHAIFLPHGYGPARFLRDELAQLLPGLLRPEDRFVFGPIYYAGGTTTRDITPTQLAAAVTDPRVTAVDDRDEVVAHLAATAAAPAMVLLMGARDPSLPDLARGILAGLSRRCLIDGGFHAG